MVLFNTKSNLATQQRFIRRDKVRPHNSNSLNPDPGQRLMDVWDIFTPEVVVRLQQEKSPSDRLQYRLAVIRAAGLNPSRQNRELRAFKAAWEAYLTAGFAIGLFDGTHGKELRTRLAGMDDTNFSSVISECFAAWYLAGHRRLIVRSRPAGRDRRRLEFSIECAGGRHQRRGKGNPIVNSQGNPSGGVMAATFSKERSNRRKNSSRRGSAICLSFISDCDYRSSRNSTAHPSSAPLSAK
jgi:hypothetical protein